MADNLDLLNAAVSLLTRAVLLPGNIERHVFAETRFTAYRLRNAA